MKSQAFLILIALFLLSFSSVATGQNITELKIEDITTKVEAGSLVQFSFSVGNRVGPACVAEIDYWIGTEEERIIEGRNSVFLGEGETKSETASLLVPDDVKGVKSFYMQMKCNDAVVFASKPMKITMAIPTILEFGSLDILDMPENRGEQPLGFSYVIESNRGDETPIYVEETILKDNNVVWSTAQESFIAGERAFEKKGPLLLPGKYTLVVNATYSGKTASITREFRVLSPIAPFPLFSLLTFVAVALAFAVLLFVFVRFFLFGQKSFRSIGPSVSSSLQPSSPTPAMQSRQGMCVVESEANGVLDSASLNQLLDDAGFSEEQKQGSFSVASSVPVAQTVKSCVFTSAKQKMSFMTIVKITVSNNTAMEWRNVVVIARIPAFLSGDIEQFSSDAEMGVDESGSTVRFTLKKVGILHSASIVYVSPKLISQEEADAIPLPAVVSFKESRRAVVPPLTVKRNAVGEIVFKKRKAGGKRGKAKGKKRS